MAMANGVKCFTISFRNAFSARYIYVSWLKMELKSGEGDDRNAKYIPLNMHTIGQTCKSTFLLLYF